MAFKLLIKIRSFFSPIFYWLFRWTIYRGELPDIWSTIRDFDYHNFGVSINSYKYKADFRLFDFSPYEPNFFFIDRKRNRDCDDYAKMWYWWAQHNEYPVWLIVLADGWKMGHKTTVFKKDGKFYLADYYVVGSYDSLEEAMEQFRITDRYGEDSYLNLQWAVSKFSK